MTHYLRRNAVLFLMVLISFLSLAVVQYFPAGSLESDEGDYKDQATDLMAEAMQVLRKARVSLGLEIDRQIDPNMTGLIGREVSPLMTTLGPVEVKRTTTNPNFAAVMVDLLMRAGVQPGDHVTAGISGSFPALALALFCAVEVLDLELVAIYSLGASTYGATDPEFVWLDMESILMDAGIITDGSVAASLGGENDNLDNSFFSGARKVARTAIRRNGVFLIEEGSFREAVDTRMEVYLQHTRLEEIKAFINIGGAEVNLGKCDAGYKLPSGVVHSIYQCPEDMQGVVSRMMASEIPVINLLNIRDLAISYNLPIDPIPLPGPGNGGLIYRTSGSFFPVIILAIYCILVILCICIDRNLNKR